MKNYFHYMSNRYLSLDLLDELLFLLDVPQQHSVQNFVLLHLQHVPFLIVELRAV
jgi:hypothetical protein